MKRFVLLAAAFGMLACTGPDEGTLDRTKSARATLQTFRQANVSAVLEKRCGSLDCHGSAERNMRIYSGAGLRLPVEAGASPTPGSSDTTADETLATYHSIMALEPEPMNKVLGGGDPTQLLLLKKPLGRERHRGGAAIRQDDAVVQCLTAWLTEDPNKPSPKASCDSALVFPKE